ncbi:DUF6064 family protein [Desertibaculum subflavum]|uniref:DUF6064 family protein n=1 Tax=Desertibaculum subflavum TaxID=2268458 RepID=UPI000E66E54A
MSEWWTYSLADFLMFSPRTYWRLFELYNRDIWPAQLPALAAGAALPLLARRRGAAAQRFLALLLAAAWAWPAWGFLFARYDTINWAGRYFALGFAVEALLIAVLGAAAGRLRIGPFDGAAGRTGLALFLAALLFYPLLAGISGRVWAGAEIFGLAPDPTAIGTLGLLLAARGHSARVLSVIPLVWCLVTGAALWTMNAWQTLLPLAAVLLIVVLPAARHCYKKNITM